VSDVFYKLLGMVTWKAFRLYLQQKLPSKTVAAITVIAGIAVVSGIAALRDHDEA
jgi:hypothetical protein